MDGSGDGLLSMRLSNVYLFLRDTRHWKLISAQTTFHQEYRHQLAYVADRHFNMLLLEGCPGGNYSMRCHGGDVYEYPYVLQVGGVPVQCAKLNFWSTRPKTDVLYMLYTKFHLPRPIFYSPSSKRTCIGER